MCKFTASDLDIPEKYWCDIVWTEDTAKFLGYHRSYHICSKMLLNPKISTSKVRFEDGKIMLWETVFQLTFLTEKYWRLDKQRNVLKGSDNLPNLMSLWKLHLSIACVSIQETSWRCHFQENLMSKILLYFYMDVSKLIVNVIFVFLIVNKLLWFFFFFTCAAYLGLCYHQNILSHSIFLFH